MLSSNCNIGKMFFICSSTKLWKPLMQHPLVSQANLKSENIILEQHMKQEIVARIMLKNLVSVDIQGKGGVGKTTILQNLLQINVGLYSFRK